MSDYTDAHNLDHDFLMLLKHYYESVAADEQEQMDRIQQELDRRRFGLAIHHAWDVSSIPGLPTSRTSF